MANRLDDLSAKPASGEARTKAGEPIPRAAGNRLPPPTRPPRVRLVSVPPVAAAPATAPVAAAEPAPASVEPALVVAGTIRRGEERTQIVAPLPSPFDAPKRRRRWRAATPRVIVDRALVESGLRRVASGTRTAIAAVRRWGATSLIGAAALVAVIAGVAIGFSDDEVARPARLEVVPAAAQVVVEPLPASASAAAALPVESSPAPRAEGATQEVATPRRTRHRTKVAPRAGAPAISAKAKPAKLTYDPDALFLKHH